MSCEGESGKVIVLEAPLFGVDKHWSVLWVKEVTDLTTLQLLTLSIGALEDRNLVPGNMDI